MPGPPPKPTRIKASEGNPGRRPLNKGELAGPAEEPVAPGWLDREAKKIWREQVRELMKLKLLKRVDQAQLANLCDAIATLAQTKRILKKLPADARAMIKMPSGAVVQNPLLGVINQQRVTIHKIATEFGMTPASRARLSFQDEGGGAGDIDDLLDAPREVLDDDDALTLQ